MEGWQNAVAGAARAWLARVDSVPIGRRFDAHGAQLGWLQRWYLAQPVQRVVVCVLELATDLSPGALEAALRELCARHAGALGVCEERSPTRLRLRPLTAADPVPWYGGRADVELWQLAAELTQLRFDVGAPLFRVALHGARRVLCAFEHSIADGVSVALLAGELARLLQAEPLQPLAAGYALPLDARLDLRPSLGDVVRALRPAAEAVTLAPPLAGPSARDRSWLSCARCQCGPSSRKPGGRRAEQCSVRALDRARIASSRSTQILPFELPRAQVESLLSRARSHAVTLHAVLSAAGLRAALDALEQREARLRLCTPISLRERCQPRPDGAGVYIASLDSDFVVAQHSELWSLAAAYMRELRAQRPAAQRKVGLLAFAGDLHKLALERERRHSGRTATLEVSNVGVVRELPAGAKLWLTQGAHYHAALFVLTVATSDDGGLRACLSYPAPLCDARRAERFFGAFSQHLAAMQQARAPDPFLG